MMYEIIDITGGKNDSLTVDSGGQYNKGDEIIYNSTYYQIVRIITDFDDYKVKVHVIREGTV